MEKGKGQRNITVKTAAGAMIGGAAAAYTLSIFIKAASTFIKKRIVPGSYVYNKIAKEIELADELNSKYFEQALIPEFLPKISHFADDEANDDEEEKEQELNSITEKMKSEDEVTIDKLAHENDEVTAKSAKSNTSDIEDLQKSVAADYSSFVDIVTSGLLRITLLPIVSSCSSLISSLLLANAFENCERAGINWSAYELVDQDKKSSMENELIVLKNLICDRSTNAIIKVVKELLVIVTEKVSKFVKKHLLVTVTPEVLCTYPNKLGKELLPPTVLINIMANVLEECAGNIIEQDTSKYLIYEKSLSAVKLVFVALYNVKEFLNDKKFRPQMEEALNSLIEIRRKDVYDTMQYYRPKRPTLLPMYVGLIEAMGKSDLASKRKTRLQLEKGLELAYGYLPPKKE